MRKQSTKHSALKFVLLGLVPYSRQNLMLSFKPSNFFSELEKQTKYSERTLKQAYTRAQKRGLIDSLQPKLTSAGYRQIQPFIAKRLKNEAQLMVIFDVPEVEAALRRKFRWILRGWGFQQVQKSVWISDMDYRAALKNVISDLGIYGYAEIYECSKL